MDEHMVIAISWNAGLAAFLLLFLVTGLIIGDTVCMCMTDSGLSDDWFCVSTCWAMSIVAFAFSIVIGYETYRVVRKWLVARHGK